VAKFEARVIESEAELEVLEASIPAVWDSARKRYLELSGAEKKARLTYRRNVDQAYEPIIETQLIIENAEAFAAIEDQVTGLPEAIATQPLEQAIESVRAVESALARLVDTSSIRSALTQSRRAMTARNPNPEKALEESQKAVAIYTDELTWRTRAARELASGLAEYEAAIAETIGLRQQDRLPSSKISETASCLAVHRDISLNF
jgi:hypothetical protein